LHEEGIFHRQPFLIAVFHSSLSFLVPTSQHLLSLSIHDVPISHNCQVFLPVDFAQVSIKLLVHFFPVTFQIGAQDFKDEELI
jgi:hypothetical protein